MKFTVTEHDGHALTYDTDDVEEMDIRTSIDVREVGEQNGFVVREHGKEHLYFHARFKEGHGPRWTDKEIEAAN